VELFLADLKGPRQIRMAPNGDFFVAETSAGENQGNSRPRRRWQAAAGGNFAADKGAFGINFYPLGQPAVGLVGNTASVVRFPYKNGDLKAMGSAEIIYPSCHGRALHARCGFFEGWQEHAGRGRSGSNVTIRIRTRGNSPRNILEYTPDGKFVRVYAGGISQSC